MQTNQSPSKGSLMKINTFITILLSLTLIFACDDDETSKSSDVESGGIEQVDASVDAGESAGESAGTDIPVQMMDFDTMEIEPDSDMGPDMDD